MLKRFFSFFGLFVLSSCSQNLIYSEIAPSWVNAVRSGDSSLRVVSGNKILFRANQKGKGRDGRENICASAIEKNISYIKKAYPFSVQIPMTVELVFFDPKVKDCSTTISISRQLIEKAESLSELKGQYEKEMKRIKKETQKVQADLKKVNAEKKVLESKIKKLDKLIAENQVYARQIKTIEDFIEYAKNERKQIKTKIENYIYTGMSYNEVAKVMYGHDYQADYTYDTICGERNEYYTRYMDYVLCGVRLPKYTYDSSATGFVKKICNVKTASCYTKEIEY